MLALGVMGCGETAGDPGGSGGDGGMGGGGTGGTDLCEGIDCDDGSDCTEDVCADGVCSNNAIADDTECDFGEHPGLCTSGICQGVCEGIDCDDGNECTENTCDPADGSCDSTPLPDGSFCTGGYCENTECDPIASLFPCTEQGIRDAIEAGGGPHGFDCDGPTSVPIAATIEIDNDVILDGLDELTVGRDANLTATLLLVPEGTQADIRRLRVTDSWLGIAGVTNSGSLTLTRCMVFNNGGAGISSSAGTLELVQSVVSGNGVAHDHVNDVGIRVSGGVAMLSGSRVSSNAFGIYNGGGLVTIRNSTISHNRWSCCGRFGCGTCPGVGISNSATMEVVHSTVTNNDIGIRNAGTLTLAGTLVAGTCGGSAVTSLGHNIQSPGATCGFDQPTDQVNVSADDLMLGLLQDNGGPTETHALGEGSVAIDVIPADMCEVDEDQRGFPRDSMCDVGAFEVQP